MVNLKKGTIHDTKLKDKMRNEFPRDCQSNSLEREPGGPVLITLLSPHLATVEYLTEPGRAYLERIGDISAYGVIRNDPGGRLVPVPWDDISRFELHGSVPA